MLFVYDHSLSFNHPWYWHFIANKPEPGSQDFVYDVRHPIFWGCSSYVYMRAVYWQTKTGLLVRNCAFEPE